MVTIEQKQTKEKKVIQITEWLTKYDHELWDVVEIKDAVVICYKIDGEWVKYNTIEKEHALRIIKTHPNDSIKYEISDLNTPLSKRQINKTSDVNDIPELLLFMKGKILQYNNGIDAFYKLLEDAVGKGFIECDYITYKLTSKGEEELNRLISTPTMIPSTKESRSEQMVELLKDALSNGFISYSKSNSKEYIDLLLEALDIGYLKETSKYSFRITPIGRDLLNTKESSKLDAVQQPEIYVTKLSDTKTGTTNVYNGPVTQVNHSNGKYTIDQSQNKNIETQQKSDKKDIFYWVKWLVGIITGLGTLYAAIKGIS